MFIKNAELQNPDPERQMEIVRRILKGETVKEYGGDVQIALQIAEIAAKKSGDEKYEQELIRIKELVGRKLAGKDIKSGKTDLGEKNHEGPIAPEVPGPETIIGDIDEKIRYAEILLSVGAEDIVKDNEKLGREEISAVKMRIQEAESAGVNVGAQRKKLLDLIKNHPDNPIPSPDKSLKRH